MKRLSQVRRIKLDRIDAVVLCALVGIAVSFYLGAGLDWTQADLQAPLESQASAMEPVKTVPVMRQASVAPVTAFASHKPEDTGKTEAPDPAWSELVRRLAAEAISYNGRAAIYLKDLKRNRVWAYHADDLFPSASLIKVPIMMSVFDKISRGELSLQTRVTLLRRHRTGGSGSLKWYRDGSQFAVRALIEKMIDESDNTATKMLIENVGLGFLQQQFPKMGLVYTEIYPEGLSLRGSHVTYENYTTAREMSALLEAIYRGESVDRYSSQLMLDIMKRQKSRARLAKALPIGWEIAHKTGLLRRACHDSAIIFTPQGDYVITVLTGQNRDYGEAKDFITRLGKITYKYYQGDRSFYARASEYRLAQRSGSVVD